MGRTRLRFGLAVAALTVFLAATAAHAQIKNAEGHLPETHRDQLPDLSLRQDELEVALDRLVSRLNVAVSAIQKLAVRNRAEAVRIAREKGWL